MHTLFALLSDAIVELVAYPGDGKAGWDDVPADGKAGWAPSNDGKAGW